MLLQVNLRHLERKPILLEGQVAAADLDLDGIDDLIGSTLPLTLSLTVERQSSGIYVHGRLEIGLDCECARCLKRFGHWVRLDPYDILVPLEGEERVELVGDCVDLTPFVREDILLGFPQRPLCGPGCGGLAGVKPARKGPESSEGGGSQETSSPWSKLDGLKL